jgi:hypothetical protein
VLDQVLWSILSKVLDIGTVRVTGLRPALFHGSIRISFSVSLFTWRWRQIQPLKHAASPVSLRYSDLYETQMDQKCIKINIIINISPSVLLRILVVLSLNYCGAHMNLFFSLIIFLEMLKKKIFPLQSFLTVCFFKLQHFLHAQIPPPLPLTVHEW